MKIRIYPKKSVIMAQLESKAASIESDLAAAEAHWAKLGSSSLFVPEADKRFAEASVDAFAADLADVKKTIETLESHSPPEVMAEFEV